MLLDRNGRPIKESERWPKRWWRSGKSWVSTSKGVIAFLGALALLLVNLDGVMDFYERITGGPTIEVALKVSNRSEQVIEIDPLLDLHISFTAFYSGRLMGGEGPSARLRLRSDQPSGLGSPFAIEPDSTRFYVTGLSEREYSDVLNTGQANAVFVLRVGESNAIRWIEIPFTKEGLESTTLVYTISPDAR